MMIVLAALLAQTEVEATTLTPAGVAIMVASVLLVLALCVFCFWRILREPNPSEHHHVPLDIDSRDFEG